MKFISTRGYSEKFDSAQVIKMGIAPDGGLFVPESIPVITQDDINEMMLMTYPQLAAKVISMYLTDYTKQELQEYCDLAYSEEKFGEDPLPLVLLNKYNPREYILELWHGPTCAFKDVALQLLPYLMTAAVRKTGENRKVVILTATSGDTGKAALEGFKDVPGTEVIVFYPVDGVSDAQRLQMVTTEGDNVHVVAVDGCFDDAQTGVKSIFSDEDLNQELHNQGVMLSSANSINWGRLVPQIAYYVYSYVSLLKNEAIEPGEKVNFVVPTGNFGNILAAWFAKEMGIPVHKLICASNKNKVLSDFFRSGTYDRNRPFYKTNSPSMDILISSNLERLLFKVSGGQAERLLDWMKELTETGKYAVDNQTLRILQSAFVGGFADEIGINKTIRDVYDRCDHVVDTHTAVGFNVYSRYYQRSGDETKTIFVSTASPYKFTASVSDALFGAGYSKGRSHDVLMRELSEESGMPIPESISNLSAKAVLHDKTVAKDQMKSAVMSIIAGDS
ncbi:MAG TPA: threonine synthase [Clostridiaceae bacterium]|nr:threonine synthase [Clostridiaceae bacterium]